MTSQTLPDDFHSIPTYEVIAYTQNAHNAPTLGQVSAMLNRQAGPKYRVAVIGWDGSERPVFRGGRETMEPCFRVTARTHGMDDARLVRAFMCDPLGLVGVHIADPEHDEPEATHRPASITYEFWSPKGGQGCTVTACAVAIMLAEAGKRTLLLDKQGDAHGALGLPDSLDGQLHTDVKPGLDLAKHDAPTDRPYDVVVIDAGTTERTHNGGIMVVEPCYLALRRAIAGPKPDAVVLTRAGNGRSLGGADVRHCLGVPVVATIEHDPAIPRAVDAGLLAGNLPRILRRSLERATLTSERGTS